jgi:hypothetical protein
MGGILQQTARSVAALLGAASSGADAASVRTAYAALSDQLAIAAREAAVLPLDAPARFEARAAQVVGRGCAPLLAALGAGRDPSFESAVARLSTTWVGDAYEAFAAGDLLGMERCFRVAEVFLTSDADPSAPRPELPG